MHRAESFRRRMLMGWTLRRRGAHLTGDAGEGRQQPSRAVRRVDHGKGLRGEGAPAPEGAGENLPRQTPL